MELGVQAEQLERARAGVDAAVLEHQPDSGSKSPPVSPGVQPEDPDIAVVGLPIALEQLDGRGLARSVGPEQREQLTPADRERHAGEHGSPAVRLVDPVDDDRVRGLDGSLDRHPAIFA